MLGTLNGETERILAEGQGAARKGDKPAARALLTQVVERDPHNELAWMWLSGVVEEPEEQQICLENVLVINPHNDKARRGLEFISTKTGVPPNFPPTSSERDANIAELTAPLTADSPFYGDFSGQLGAWPTSDAVSLQSSPDGGGEEASAAVLAWMQTPDAAAGDPTPDVSSPFMSQYSTPVQDGGDAQGNSWDVPAKPFQQEQLDWNQPPSQFSAMSLADGVDGRLAQMEARPGGGNLPWSDGSSGGDIFGGQDMPFGAEPFSVGMGAAGALAGAGASAPVAGTGSAMGPMGLHSDSHLPAPSELPKFEEPSERPWYLQSEQTVASDADSFASRTLSEPTDNTRQASTKTEKKDTHATVECPHCKALVDDTTLSCPQCKFGFFINCPHCHELVDAADAKEGVTDPCPYCKKPINRMELGMAGTDSALSYKSTKASSASMAQKAMEELEAAHKVKRPVNFAWVVDVVWLVMIVAAVWALSQLPTWLRLTGQY